MAQTPEGYRNSSPQQAQFDYAWRWFDVHAKQRVTMFNFFLLATGLIANAYGLMFREDLYLQAAVVAFIGAVVGGVSFMLDVRNSQLVDMGEAALKSVEQNYLDPVLVETEVQPLRILSKEEQPPFWQKHKFLIRFLETVAILGYLAACGHSVWAAQYF